MFGEPIPLKHPVEQKYRSANGEERVETLSEVTLRRPNGDDMTLFDRFNQRPAELMLQMISTLSGLDRKLVGKLDAEDIDALGELALPGDKSGQTTGEIS